MDLASQGSYPTTPASTGGGGQSTHAQMAGEGGGERRESGREAEGHPKSVEMQDHHEKVPVQKAARMLVWSSTSVPTPLFHSS